MAHMDVEEYIGLAQEVIEELRPALIDGWDGLVDGEMDGGEFYIAVDDALQAAVKAHLKVNPGIIPKVLALTDKLDVDDKARTREWLDQLQYQAAA